MRWVNILENKVSCKHLYEKTWTILVHVQGTCRKPNVYRQEKRPRYMWTLTRLFYTHCSSTCKFLNVL